MSEAQQISYEPTLPASVRRAGARSEELSRQLADGANTTTVVEIDPTPPQGERFTESAPAPDAPGEQDGGDQPSPAPAPAQQDDWQQRYNSLKGKYDSEVPTMSGELRSLRSQVSQLHGLLASLQSAPAPAHTPAPARESAPVVIPEQDIADYGELVPAARRWARAEVEPEFAQLRDQVNQLKGQLQSINTRSDETAVSLAKRSVEQELDAAVENWRVINNDQRFTAWLDQTDPFSGRRRHDMLTEAYVAGDGPRTSAFFRAFLSEQTAVTQGSGTQPAHTPAQGGGADRLSLEELAAPGRGTATPSSQGAPAGKRFWAPTQIAAFYKDCAMGKYEGREAVRQRTENDIFAAQSEGRVR